MWKLTLDTCTGCGKQKMVAVRGKHKCEPCLRRDMYHANAERNRAMKNETARKRCDKRVASGLTRIKKYPKECSVCRKTKNNVARGICAACLHAKRMKSDPAYRADNRRKNRLSDDRNKTAVNTLTASANGLAKRRGKRGLIRVSEIRPLFADDLMGAPAAHCAYCGCLVICGINATLDHCDPAGPHSIENVCVSCRSCNASKFTLTAVEFRRRLDNEPEVIERSLQQNDRALVAHFAVAIGLTMKDITRIAASQSG